MPLTLVPTPIGNLEDITLRALGVLKNSDLIACEDTRTSSVLLRHYEITAPLIPFHLHNENRCLLQLMEALRQGKKVSVISDAGMPGISDPGWILMKKAMEEGLAVDVLPGPSALLPALLLSGLSPHPFFFYGFPPEKPGARKKLFLSLAALPCTLCFYVSPHKVERQLSEMASVFGDRRCSLVREISKIHQEAIRGTFSEVLRHVKAGVKGELVLAIEGAVPDSSEDDWQASALELMEAGKTSRTVVQEVVSRFGVPKNVVKSFLLKEKAESEDRGEPPD